MKTSVYIIILLLILGLGLGLGLGLNTKSNKINNIDEYKKLDKIEHIQKNIFQTHKSQEYIDNNSKLKSAQKSWKKQSGYSYHFYNNDDCDTFMKNEFPDIYSIYKNLPKPVMKADMWRYCIIYKYGGIYADADTVCVHNNIDEILNIESSQLIGVPENSVHMCQWIFSAPKGSLILKHVIDLIVERSVEANIDEHYIHYKTGPGVFTCGITNYLKEYNLTTYDDKLLYEKYKNQHIFIHNHSLFHSKYVKHLFSGQWGDGWTKTR